MKMKKILPLILITVLVFCGCSEEILQAPEEDSFSQSDNISVETDTSTDSSEKVNSESVNKSNFPQYNIIRVVDGDTIVIDYNGTDEKVRLIGVDTPESVHPDKSKNTEFGDIVSSYSKEKLDGQKVGIEFDVQERDQYGRLLAYVYVGDKMYNKSLLKKGYASVATFPPNVKYVDEFTAIQKKAVDKGKGMWASEFTASSKDNSSNLKNTNTKNASNSYSGHNKNMKFHAPGCRYGDMISDDNLTVFKTREAAIDAGYAACKVCNP